MTCAICREGEHDQCCFKGPFFSPEGWNCGTVSRLRELVDPDLDLEPLSSRLSSRYVGDDRFVTIMTYGIENLQDYSFALNLYWYKDRGRTDGAWLILKDEPPRAPTESELLAVIDIIELELLNGFR
jgi:hypothetical protein